MYFFLIGTNLDKWLDISLQVIRNKNYSNMNKNDYNNDWTYQV